jgi:hypothetical protein
MSDAGIGYKPKDFIPFLFRLASASHASRPRRKIADTLQLKGVPIDDARFGRRIVGEVHLRFDNAESEPLNDLKLFTRGADHGTFDAGTGHKADP